MGEDQFAWLCLRCRQHGARPRIPPRRIDAQAQARHSLIDDFILDAVPLIGEGGSDGLGSD
jgi:hypothetical protein